MSREVDRRDFSVNRVTPAREGELRSAASKVSDSLPATQRVQITSFDPVTGNPTKVVSQAAPPEKGNYVQRALNHVTSISQVLGLAATQPVEFTADPHFQVTNSGAVTVHVQQNYKGVPIFHAAQAVRFAPDGALKDSIGSSITVFQEQEVSPELTVQEAVLKAAQHVAAPTPDEQGSTDQFGQPLKLTSVDLTGFVPKVLTSFPDKADRPTMLEAGPFEDKIRGSLTWFPLGDDVRLAWEFVIAMPNYAGQYRVVVDASSGEILYCHQLIQSVAATGNVFRVDGGGTRQTTDFPRLLTDYGLPVPGGLPGAFPSDWVAVDRTVGNSTDAHQGVSGASFQGAVQSGVVTFSPANASGVDAQVLNIFYYCCYMHDYFYLLGFREADGNFQQDNFGLGGAQGDRVDARAHPGAVWGTANMGTPVDGSSPVMNMGLVVNTNRHTALDSTVVFHEFMHGVTNRLVGGPLNVHALDDPQSAGMGEGWGDFIACTINNVTVLGNWVLNNTGGIRNFPYDTNYPRDFGDVGQTVGGINFSEVHNMGEIWCATLMEMNRCIGANLGVQLVVDALKLAPANPSFLDMRNSILDALDDMLSAGRLNASQYAVARHGIRQSFGKFGMGICATCNGASLIGIVADFDDGTPVVTVTGGTFTYDGVAHVATAQAHACHGTVLGAFSFTYNGSSNPPVNAGTYNVVATFTSSDKDYVDATATGLITIDKATPTIKWRDPDPIDHGTPLDATQLNASTTIPGTLHYNPDFDALLDVGTHTLSVTFIPVDSVNYNTVTATAQIKVLTGYPIVTSASFSPVVIPLNIAHPVLTVTVTVVNDSVRPHVSQGPNPGFEYSEGDTFQTKGFPSIDGAYRIGVDLVETTYTVDHLYRWGFGKNLAPGESVQVTGVIRCHNKDHNGQYYVGMILEKNQVVQDQQGTTVITVVDSLP